MRVVVLSSYDQQEYVLEALRAGAVGYVLKGASKHELLATIRNVVAGGVHLQAPTALRLLRQHWPSAAADTRGLSGRELEVLRLLARGRTNTAIGHELHLSVNTVKTHVQRILRKLEAPDRAAAVARAARLGLLESSPPGG